MCLLGRSASADPGFLDRGSNFHRGGGGDLLTLPDSFLKILHENEIILAQSEPLNSPGPAIDQTSLCYGNARRGGGGGA